MARSRRHTPIVPITTATTEKQDKQRANRSHRSAVRRALKHEDAAEVILPVLDDVSNVATMAKDGRQWVGDRHPKMLRK